MPKVLQSFPAREDLKQIWLYVAKRNPSAADRLIDKFERTLYSLARNPLIGESADSYREGLRRFTVGNYVLYFERMKDGVRLVRVLHGARKADDLLS